MILRQNDIPAPPGVSPRTMAKEISPFIRLWQTWVLRFASMWTSILGYLRMKAESTSGSR